MIYVPMTDDGYLVWSFASSSKNEVRERIQRYHGKMIFRAICIIDYEITGECTIK